MDSHLLEITLISAQDLKPPSNHRFMHTYAVSWVDPSTKLRTRVDRVGADNPTWNDKFIFRVPAAFLAADSSSAVSVDIFASGGWCLPDSLVGSVRLLIGNHRLLSSPPGVPSFAAVGIRRPSGRFHGVLNVGAMLLSHVSQLTAEALAESPAVGFRDLMGENPKNRRRSAAAAIGGESRRVLKDRNREREGDEGSDGWGVLCGLGFPRKIHLSPSDQDLHNSWSQEK